MGALSRGDDVVIRCGSGLSKRGKVLVDGDSREEKSAVAQQYADLKNFPIHDAAAAGDCETCESLIQRGANVNVPGEGGKRPLHIAILGLHEDVVTLLLERNAQTNTVDEHGYAPLHYAALFDNHVAIRQLLSHRTTDVLLQDRSGETALHVAIKAGSVLAARVLLEWAGAVTSTEGSVDEERAGVERLLAAVDVRGNSPMWYAKKSRDAGVRDDILPLMASMGVTELHAGSAPVVPTTSAAMRQTRPPRTAPPVLTPNGVRTTASAAPSPRPPGTVSATATPRTKRKWLRKESAVDAEEVGNSGSSDGDDVKTPAGATKSRWLANTESDDEDESLGSSDNDGDEEEEDIPSSFRSFSALGMICSPLIMSPRMKSTAKSPRNQTLVQNQQSQSPLPKPPRLLTARGGAASVDKDSPLAMLRKQQASIKPRGPILSRLGLGATVANGTGNGTGGDEASVDAKSPLKTPRSARSDVFLSSADRSPASNMSSPKIRVPVKMRNSTRLEVPQSVLREIESISEQAQLNSCGE